jgi:hypothetical protein
MEKFYIISESSLRRAIELGFIDGCTFGYTENAKDIDEWVCNREKSKQKTIDEAVNFIYKQEVKKG